jgi:D-glycero-D-manno-heptose 1,7-bisphosphate phosphatase
MKKNRAIFLDRDGTINRDVGYPNSYSMIEIYPYSFEAVRKIKDAGFLAVIVTNQSGIGKGFIEEKNLHDIHRRLRSDFAEKKGSFDGIYY